MSEEIAQAAADLATVEALRAQLAQAEAEIKALRSLDQLDQALSAMSVTEIDSARAQIDSALVPQLARMLALCLVKESGELYNHVSWALGSAEPFGAMELILQRTEGKTPTQLRIEAEAELSKARTIVQAADNLSIAMRDVETAQIHAQDTAARIAADRHWRTLRGLLEERAIGKAGE